jgi:Fe-Mn family superoxide dismutase
VGRTTASSSEHSYQLDYGASAERYVDAFMENIDWARVARLMATAGASAAG